MGIRKQAPAAPPFDPSAQGSVGPYGSLAARWRSDAAVLLRRGAPELADVLEGTATELERWAEEWAQELLTLGQAAAESGFSYSALEKGVRAGRIRNSGTKGEPLIRRSDSPRKAIALGGPDLASRVLKARRG